MTKTLTVAALFFAVFGYLFMPQDEIKLTNAQLKTIVDNMGHTTKLLDDKSGKFEIAMKTDEFNIPVSAEVSPSGNYIWFTVFLGDAAKVEKNYADLLKQNAEIQPDFFYVTGKGRLMLGVAVDNRSVNAAIVKRVTDKLVQDVGKTSTYWKAP